MVPSDVLLPGLECQTEAVLVVHVSGHADHPAGDAPDKLAPKNEKKNNFGSNDRHSRVPRVVSHRHAKNPAWGPP